jgi:1-phosphatidylinositol phosphodiesterase
MLHFRAHNGVMQDSFAIRPRLRNPAMPTACPRPPAPPEYPPGNAGGRDVLRQSRVATRTQGPPATYRVPPAKDRKMDQPILDYVRDVDGLFWIKLDPGPNHKRLAGPHPIGDTGPCKPIQLLPADTGVIYAITEDQRLYWLHVPLWSAAPGRIEAPVPLGTLDGLSRFSSAGSGVFYAVAPDGTLTWLRNDHWQTGAIGDSTTRCVSTADWRGYKYILPAGDGVLYAIDAAGKLWWFRHMDWRNGTGTLEGPRPLRQQIVEFWSRYDHVTAAHDHTIYFISGSHLFSLQHTGWADGADTWDGPTQSAEPLWQGCRTVCAMPYGVIFRLGGLTSSWMNTISSDRYLSQLTIPGTHDTGTWPLSDTVDVGGVAYTNNAKCQSLTLRQQFGLGVRFIDIRLQLAEDVNRWDFRVFHGPVFTGLWFSQDIVPVCAEFLKNHPSETIVMSVTNDSGAPQQAFEHWLKHWLDTLPFFSGNALPSLGEARGKLILLRRFPGTLGIAVYPGWPDDDIGAIHIDGNSYGIQDVYGYGFSGDNLVTDQPKREKLDKKWTFVQTYLEQAPHEIGLLCVFFNFLSASGPPTMINPVDFAKGNWGAAGMNARTLDFLTRPEHKYGHYGFVIMDFPEYPNEGALVSTLINTNYAPRPPSAIPTLPGA